MIILTGLGAWFGVEAPADLRRVVERSRNLYGALRVEKENTDDSLWQVYYLFHGRTIHGYQMRAQSKSKLPTAYFSKETGIGRVLGSNWNHGRRVGCIGLGIGTIAAYGRRGDSFRFYEINPDIVRIARGDNDYFSFLTESEAVVETVLGDGRLSLEHELYERGSMQFDVLAIDAFNSDAIPVHLLTVEAFEIYLAHLKKPSGVLALHITNRYLDLEPVLWALADRFQLSSAWIFARESSGQRARSSWMLLSRDRAILARPEIAEAARPRPAQLDAPLWTDDYSNLFRVVRW